MRVRDRADHPRGHAVARSSAAWSARSRRRRRARRAARPPGRACRPRGCRPRCRGGCGAARAPRSSASTRSSCSRRRSGLKPVRDRELGGVVGDREVLVTELGSGARHALDSASRRRTSPSACAGRRAASRAPRRPARPPPTRPHRRRRARGARGSWGLPPAMASVDDAGGGVADAGQLAERAALGAGPRARRGRWSRRTIGGLSERLDLVPGRLAALEQEGDPVQCFQRFHASKVPSGHRETPLTTSRAHGGWDRAPGTLSSTGLPDRRSDASDLHLPARACGRIFGCAARGSRADEAVGGPGVRRLAGARAGAVAARTGSQRPVAPARPSSAGRRGVRARLDAPARS